MSLIACFVGNYTHQRALSLVALLMFDGVESRVDTENRDGDSLGPSVTEGFSELSTIHASTRTPQPGVRHAGAHPKSGVPCMCRCLYYPTERLLSIENRPLRVFILTWCGDRLQLGARRSHFAEELGRPAGARCGALRTPSALAGRQHIRRVSYRREPAGYASQFCRSLGH